MANIAVADNSLDHSGVDVHDPLPRLLRVFALGLELHDLPSSRACDRNQRALKRVQLNQQRFTRGRNFIL